MMSKFKPIDRGAPYLLPPLLQDWLPDEHLARFVRHRGSYGPERTDRQISRARVGRVSPGAAVVVVDLRLRHNPALIPTATDGIPGVREFVRYVV